MRSTEGTLCGSLRALRQGPRACLQLVLVGCIGWAAFSSARGQNRRPRVPPAQKPAPRWALPKPRALLHILTDRFLSACGLLISCSTHASANPTVVSFSDVLATFVAVNLAMSGHHVSAAPMAPPNSRSAVATSRLAEEGNRSKKSKLVNEQTLGAVFTRQYAEMKRLLRPPTDVRALGSEVHLKIFKTTLRPKGGTPTCGRCSSLEC